MFGKSSLYNSPHLSYNDGTKIVSKASSYDDFDSNWETACREMFRYMRANSASITPDTGHHRPSSGQKQLLLRVVSQRFSLL